MPDLKDDKSWAYNAHLESVSAALDMVEQYLKEGCEPKLAIDRVRIYVYICRKVGPRPDLGEEAYINLIERELEYLRTGKRPVRIPRARKVVQDGNHKPGGRGRLRSNKRRKAGRG